MLICLPRKICIYIVVYVVLNLCVFDVYPILFLARVLAWGSIVHVSLQLISFKAFKNNY